MAIKRSASLILALVIIFTMFAVPLTQPAHAIAGTIIVGSVIAVMAMAGITLISTGMTAAQLQNWVSNKLDTWAAARGSTVEQLISTSLIGTTISGLLMIGKSAADAINDFIDWICQEESISSNSYVTIEENGSSLDQIQGVMADHFIAPADSNPPAYNAGWFINAQFSHPVLCCKFDFSGDHRWFLFISDTPEGNWDKYGNYYAVAIGAQRIDNTDPMLNYNNGYTWTYQNWTQMLAGVTDDISEGNSLKARTTTITLPTVETDEKIFLDVGALPGSTVNEVTSGVISDVTTDTLDVSGEVAEEEPEFVIEGATPVYGLQNVFPFCIPFDLYNFLACLAADPVAPHFEWRLYVEDLVDYTFVIDLEDFETVAVILRSMFLLLFCVGLAAETRKLIRG